MFKRPDPYLDVAPWTVTETGFHPQRSRVSESMFSLANEYMGVRGFFEEGFSGDSLLGCYYNGSFESMPIEHPYTCKGFATEGRFMVAAPNWLWTRIEVDGTKLDLNACNVKDFVQTLDMKTGTLRRSFTWMLPKGRRLEVVFERFLSMTVKNLGAQRVRFTPVNFSGKVRCQVGVDFNVLHEFSNGRYWTMNRATLSGWDISAMGATSGSGQQVYSHLSVSCMGAASPKDISTDSLAGIAFDLPLRQGKETGFDRLAANTVVHDRTASTAVEWKKTLSASGSILSKGYDAHLERHIATWEDLWRRADVTIDGDVGAQQGMRFCVFHLLQTYHGVDPHCNVGAKGLTGEVYWGSAFWDIETYCVPFYAFVCPEGARNLLGFRHRTLPQAIEGAKEHGCRGARYPMVTIDGHESCGAWQYGELEIHVTAAIGFATWHYAQITGDRDFLKGPGMEMLLQICRYFASRGLWNQRDNSFGFYGVMGPDEFHMMVHNNHYTNTVVKRLMEFTIDEMARLKTGDSASYRKLIAKVKLDGAEMKEWAKMAAAMRSKEDPKTGLIEQFDGFFDLPHVDVHKIPLAEIPIQSHWVYTRIFERDMIKQPDVLMLQFLYGSQYTTEQKRVNFDYYEPRCAHESSLSPAIHSIHACELGYDKMAYEYMQYSLRLDLDNFNRNSREGLHVTSMGAAWMNLTYGFAGMRSDGPLTFAPNLPKEWKGYSFHVTYQGSLLSVAVRREGVEIRLVEGEPVSVKVYGKNYRIGKAGVVVALAGRAVKTRR